jgi:23S rRNA-intervening sequence protein
VVNGEWDAAGAIKSYRDLTIWQDAMDLAESLYRVTAEFPKDELLG